MLLGIRRRETSAMILGFRIAKTCFQRSPSLLSHPLRCKLHLYSPISTLPDDFLPWLRRKSVGEFSSALSLGESVYGSSLFASTHIKTGDCILKVPFSAHLTYHNLHPEMEYLLGENVGRLAKLAVVILMERNLGQISEWAPYIHCLPPAAEMHGALLWSKEDLEMIRQSPVYKDVINEQSLVENEFLVVRQAFDHVHQFITFDDYRHACALVLSRAWGNSENLVMVPFADFANHDGESKTMLITDFQTKTSEIIAGRDYIPGEEVMIIYEEFPNSNLLMGFGFTISYNIYDQVKICIDIPEDDPLRMMKLELWHKHHMAITTGINGVDSSGNSFIIKEMISTEGKEMGQSLRSFVRVVCADSSQELDYMALEASKNDGRLAGRPLSAWSEIRAHRMLFSRIVELIEEYDASIKGLGNGKLYFDDGQLNVRKQMARDLLTGELRVLKSAHSWLSKYLLTLSSYG